ncbi:flagellar basal body-associated FliL family protein [Pseudoxanthobacter sp. M-2]
MAAAASKDAPQKGKGKGGGLWIAAGVLTVLALLTGGGLGLHLSSSLEEVITEREKEQTEKVPTEIKYSGDMVLSRLDPIIANLAAPSDTWIRVETAIVFENGKVANPEITIAEISQDIVAYLRTLTLSQLQGPMAFQHLREDLNERASLRTSGAIQELVIETMVIQ